MSKKIIINKIDDTQLRSKERVADHGEVYTAAREVNAMLDLVKQETERIDSRFLEPACGTGNFLSEILVRKLEVVKRRYAKSQSEFELYSFLAVTSMYGIDILKDNVEVCRDRLLGIFSRIYSVLYKNKCKNELLLSISYILSKNIICGDALTLQTVGDKKEAIIFSEWTFIKGKLIKRRDFAFHELLSQSDDIFLSHHISDIGERVFIPEPVKEFKPISFLRISDVEQY